MPSKAFWGVASHGEFHTIKLGCALQRLFSTFPDGWPGFGLLLLRLGVGVALIFLGVNVLVGTRESDTVGRELIAAAGGAFVLAGLWTPLTGAFLALNELWIALSLYSSPQDGHWIHIFLAVLLAGVAMLGPGAWSIDARLFGRKRLNLSPKIRDKS